MSLGAGFWNSDGRTQGGENSRPGACSRDHQQTILYILSIDVKQGSTHARRRHQTPGIIGCDPVSFLDNPHKLSIPLQPPFFQSVEPVFRHSNSGVVSSKPRCAQHRLHPEVPPKKSPPGVGLGPYTPSFLKPRYVGRMGSFWQLIPGASPGVRIEPRSGGVSPWKPIAPFPEPRRRRQQSPRLFDLKRAKAFPRIFHPRASARVRVERRSRGSA